MYLSDGEVELASKSRVAPVDDSAKNAVNNLDVPGQPATESNQTSDDTNRGLTDSEVADQAAQSSLEVSDSIVQASAQPVTSAFTPAAADNTDLSTDPTLSQANSMYRSVMLCFVC